MLNGGIGNKSLRPRLSHTVWSVVGILAFVSMMYAMDDLREGAGIVGAFGATWSSRRFWVDMALPMMAFVAAFPWAMYLVWERILGRGRGRDGGKRGGWRTIRAITLGAGAVYLIQCAYVVWNGYGKFGSLSESLEKAGLMLVYGGVVLFFLVYSLFKPSKERERAMETGDYSRVHDERHQQVVAKSAQSAMWVSMGALFVLGTIADMLVYHEPPVRAWLEAFGLLVVWQLAYDYWNKRI